MGAAAFTHPGHLFAVVVVIYAANHPLCEINLLNFKTDFLFHSYLDIQMGLQCNFLSCEFPLVFQLHIA